MAPQPRASASTPDSAAKIPIRWLTQAEAAEYIGCRTVRAFYEWRRRHHVAMGAAFRIRQSELDRVLAKPRRPRRMSPKSLANLVRRWALDGRRRSRVHDDEPSEAPVTGLPERGIEAGGETR